MTTHATLAAAVADAMTDYIDNGGVLTPQNPAILRDDTGYYYCSALCASTSDEIACTLDGGFGWWTPEVADDIEACAEKFADAI